MKKSNTKAIVLTLALMAFFANGDNYAVTPLLGEIASDLDLTIQQASLSVTAYMLTFGLFTIFIGPMGEKYGRTRIINGAAFGTAIFSCLGAVAFNLPSLIFFRAMNGAFAAGIFPVTMAFVGEVSNDDNRRSNFSLIITMMTLGAACAMIIGGFLATFASWRMVYLAYGIAELTMSFLMLKYLPKTEVSDAKLAFVDTYKEALSTKKLVATVSTIFLVGFSIMGAFTFSGTMIQDNYNVSVLVVGLVLTSFGVGNILGTYIPPLLPNVDKNKLLYTSVISGIIGALVIAYATNLMFISLGLIFLGFGFVNLQSTLVEYAQESFTKSRGTAMSMASFCIFVGGAVGTGIYGVVLNQTGNFSPIYVISAIIFVVIGLKIKASNY